MGVGAGVGVGLVVGVGAERVGGLVGYPMHTGTPPPPPLRQIDRQRNARPPRTTVGVVWRTDTHTPITKRRPHMHPHPLPHTHARRSSTSLPTACCSPKALTV